MYHDPRHHSELDLKSIADARRERSTKTGLAAMPTLALILLLPFLLVARALVWAWRKVRPAGS